MFHSSASGMPIENFRSYPMSVVALGVAKSIGRSNNTLPNNESENKSKKGNYYNGRRMKKSEIDNLVRGRAIDVFCDIWRDLDLVLICMVPNFCASIAITII